MELEHAIEVYPIDENLQAKMDKLIADGWQPVPGVPPVAIYHVMRVKQQPAAPRPGVGGYGKLVIDETKIMIVPGPNKTQ